MKNYLFFAFLVSVVLGCSKEKTISEELVGHWFYERETHLSFSTFEDLDTEGFMRFNEDETGNWIPSHGFQTFAIEWDFQFDDTKLAITKYVLGQQNFFPSHTVYDITRENEDKITLTFHVKIESVVDTLEDFEQFENIILTRME